MPIPIVILLFASILAACSPIPGPIERREHAGALATAANWHAEVIPAGQFDLLAYLPQLIRKDARLTVYIEGDGLAWINGSTPSSDPTPREPLALRLALAQPAGNAAYLGRPCQYVDAQRSACPERYWTEARFAPEVVSASSKAVDVLKERFGATRLTLVGYSGGGAVAALLAARRDDVESLITVAGNLDHRAWTTQLRLTPLSGSLNPADETGMLHGVRQMHLVGSKDPVIPASLVSAFAARFPPAQRPTVRLVPDFDHRCCWEREWPGLWREAIRNAQ